MEHENVLGKYWLHDARQKQTQLIAITNQNKSNSTAQSVLGLMTRVSVARAVCAVILAIMAVCFSPKRAWSQQTGGEISLISVVDIAGDATDRSDLGGMKKPESTSDSVADPAASTDQTFPANIFGGISAVDYSGAGNDYWFLADRGPLDGAVDWPCRLHKVRLNFANSDSNQAAAKLTAEIIETVFLEDAHGHRFTGLASALTPSDEHPVRLDPEGLRVSPQGTFYISDEYGPRLMEFSRDGRLLRELVMPAHYQCACPATTWQEELPQNVSGRQSNRGMEGLAISGDGNRLFGMMQSPLLQDCQRVDKTAKPRGCNCRLPVFSATGDLEAEYVYQLDNESLKLNEILECGPDQLLTIERDGLPGASAACKNLMLISLREATNVVGRAEALTDQGAKNVKTVRKQVLLNLLDPKWHLAGDQMPEKIESLAFGPDLPDGRRLLIVVSDNDFEMDHPTHVYAFAIPKALLEQPMTEQKLQGSELSALVD
jgi:hypothetical protein